MRSPDCYKIGKLAFAIFAVFCWFDVFAQSDGAERNLYIEWYRDCSQQSPQLFQLQINSSGEVKYEGIGQIRELGTREAVIRRPAGILRLGEKITRTEVGELSTRIEGQDHTNCLVVSAQRESGQRRLSVDARDGNRLVRRIQRQLDLGAWVCPARTGFGVVDMIECPSQVMTLVVRPPLSCYSVHVVHIFEDGTVKYFGEEITRGSTGVRRTPVADQFTMITMSELRELTTRVEGFTEIAGPQTEPPATTHAGRTLIYRGTRAELDELVRILDLATPINWAPLPADGPECEMVGSPSYVTLLG